MTSVRARIGELEQKIRDLETKQSRDDGITDKLSERLEELSKNIDKFNQLGITRDANMSNWIKENIISKIGDLTTKVAKNSLDIDKIIKTTEESNMEMSHNISSNNLMITQIDKVLIENFDKLKNMCEKLTDRVEYNNVICIKRDADMSKWVMDNIKPKVDEFNKKIPTLSYDIGTNIKAIADINDETLPKLSEKYGKIADTLQQNFNTKYDKLVEKLKQKTKKLNNLATSYNSAINGFILSIICTWIVIALLAWKIYSK